MDNHSLNTIHTTIIKEMVDAQSAMELEKERISNERKEDLLQYENKMKVTLTVQYLLTLYNNVQVLDSEHKDGVNIKEEELSSLKFINLCHLLKFAEEEKLKVGLELDETQKSKENLVKEYECRSKEVEKSNQDQLEQLRLQIEVIV